MNKWRYKCPKGHLDWSARQDGTYYCNQCNRQGRHPRFEELVDVKDPAEYHIADPDVTAI